MLTFSFFVAVFLTFSWLLYIGIYIQARLGSLLLSSLEAPEMALYLSLIIVPLLLLWIVWMGFYRFLSHDDTKNQFLVLEAGLKQNQQFYSLMTRLIDQGQKARNGQFILSQSEFLISEMNSLIAEILHRYHFIEETEHKELWRAANRGNKWSFAKALVALNSSNIYFSERLLVTAKQEKMLKGTINEFCGRYAKLLDILKKYDSERLYLNIIETGALGKAFAILAPLVDKISEQEEEEKQLSFSDFEADKEKSAQDLAEIQPEQAETIIPSAPAVQEATDENTPEFLSNLENLKTPDEIIREENIQTPLPSGKEADEIIESLAAENVDFPFSAEEKQKDPNIEINSMFENTEKEEQENDAFFPKIGNLFKKKEEDSESAETLGFTQDELDPLTLALERSFGKLSDDAPTPSSRLDKVMESENSKENDKFRFSGTQETIMKLQQELEKLQNNRKEKQD